jgi:hypothetical protein
MILILLIVIILKIVLKNILKMNNDRKEQIEKLNEIYKFYNEKEKLVNLLISKFTILEIDEFIKNIKK